MITIFNRQLLLTTFDMEKYLNVRDDLVNNNIRYRLVIRNRRDYSNPIMRKGTIYTGRRFACEYNLYVHEKDYPHAVAVLNGADL